MSRPAAPSVLLAMLLVAPLLLAEEPAPGAAPALPMNPFASARVGDWVAANVRRDMVRGNMKQVTHDYVTFKVVAVENGQAAVEVDAVSRRESGAQDANPKGSFSTDEKNRPALADYLRLLYYFEKGVPTLAGEVGVVEAKRTATGREFAGRKLAWQGAGGDRPEMQRKGALWVSADSKLGLVALVGVRRIGDAAEETGLRVVGFGSAEKTEWGKTMEEARVDEKNRDLMEPAVGDADRADIEGEKKAEGK